LGSVFRFSALYLNWLQIIGLRDTLLVPGVGCYNGGDVIIYALGNFLHYGSLYPPKQ
jgi:ABC-type enterochelin transport system permease subunit